MRIRVTRIIFAAVLAAVILLPLYNVFSLYPSFSKLLISATEDEADRLAKHLAAHLFVDIGNDPDLHFRQKVLAPEVKAMLVETLRDFRLYKLRIFSRSGEILYSSEPKEIGQINRKPYFHEIIAKGKIYSQIVRKNALSAEGASLPVEVVEVYVPTLYHGDFVGALEIYYDIGVRQRELRALTRYNSALLAVVGVISIVLVILFYRTHFSLIRTENKLNLLNAELEMRVRQELEKSRRQEQLLIHQSRHAAMGEMIAAIAHQWRQPLNALALIIQDLCDTQRHGELEGPYLEDSVDRSMKQINFMSKTIDDFRNFFRPDKSKAPFDAVFAVAEVLSLLQPNLKRNQIFCSLLCCGRTYSSEELASLPTCPDTLVTGYKNEFEQALVNIVNNARDAILDRRLHGGMEPETAGRIVFELDSDHKRVLVRIIDNGGGIPDEILPRIFDPYFSTRDPGKGTGIGLYMTRVIIEDNMGGEIGVADSTARGTTICISLPKKEQT